MEEEHHDYVEHHEHNETVKEVNHKRGNITEKMRENPWIILTFVFGVLSAVLLISVFAGGITGNVISKNKIGDLAVSFVNENLLQTPGALDSVEETSGLYKVNLNVEDEIVPLYFTKDGNWISQGSNLISIISKTTSSSTTAQADIPKSDKPVVELYVFTYCPYGTQMEKAMIPAVKLLGEAINFKIRQIGAMHGEHEKLEAERQLCIEKNYPTKFLDYVLAFAESTEIGSCSGDATCLTPKLNALYATLGIDATKINTCITSEGETLYNAEVSNAKLEGMSGSPGLIINGVDASAVMATLKDRNPEKAKGVLCTAFNEVPSECTATLSTASPSAGFGSGITTSSSSASC